MQSKSRMEFSDQKSKSCNYNLPYSSWGWRCSYHATWHHIGTKNDPICNLSKSKTRFWRFVDQYSHIYHNILVGDPLTNCRSKGRNGVVYDEESCLMNLLYFELCSKCGCYTSYVDLMNKYDKIPKCSKKFQILNHWY